MSIAALTVTPGGQDVPSTVTALITALERRNVTVFATIDHAAGARAQGLSLPDEVVVVFGNAAVGTRLMHWDPTVGIDLPLRILIWDQDGTTQIGFRDPRDLTEPDAPSEVTEAAQQMHGLLAALVGELGD